jgi:hypothetical protein
MKMVELFRLEALLTNTLDSESEVAMEILKRIRHEALLYDDRESEKD